MPPQVRSKGGGGGGGLPPCPTYISSVCPKQKTWPFWCYALNYRTVKLFASLFLCRKTVPQHNFWFQKVTQLVGQAFKQLIQRRRLTTNSRFHIQIGLIWRHRHSRYSLSHLWVRSSTEFKHIVLPKRIPPCSHEHATGLFHHQKG